MTVDIGKRKLLKISSLAATSTMLPGCALLDLIFNSKSPTDILCETTQKSLSHRATANVIKGRV